VTDTDPPAGPPLAALPSRGAGRLATLVLAVVFVLLAVALVPLSVLARQSPVVNGGETLGAIPFGVVGLLIARRQPRNPIGSPTQSATIRPDRSGNVTASPDRGARRYDRAD